MILGIKILFSCSADLRMASRKATNSRSSGMMASSDACCTIIENKDENINIVVFFLAFKELHKKKTNLRANREANSSVVIHQAEHAKNLNLITEGV